MIIEEAGTGKQDRTSYKVSLEEANLLAFLNRLPPYILKQEIWLIIELLNNTNAISYGGLTFWLDLPL